MRLLALFLVIPVIEIALFIQVGGLIGLWPTLAIVLLSAVIGVALMRSQGAHAWAEIQRSFSEMRDPTRPLAHGVMILGAGMLLLTPGFFTDAVGMALLIPGIRNAVMRQVGKRMTVTRVGIGGATMGRDPHRPPYDDGVIDGDFVVTDDEPGRTDRRPPVDLPHEIDDQTPPRAPRGSGWTRH
ncbi:FxsA family protein [Paracoccus nototheniae]|uniref:FxsA family protein n=1 Tax=Paracoccus nototheniae TaxID=2489002 RepID=A0ABW4DW37_9RHOB|nr:FxsA family protein [Paracoccus nototheniae]